MNKPVSTKELLITMAILKSNKIKDIELSQEQAKAWIDKQRRG